MNWTLILLGIGFTWFETVFFGNHWLPSCMSEALCDGAGSVLMLTGMCWNFFGGVE